MSVNDPNAVVAARQPRLRVLLDGNPLPGALQATWTATSHYSPDTWNVTFALNADPRFGPAWWDNRDTALTLDVQAGMAVPGGAIQWASLGIGAVDGHIFSHDMTQVQAEGRDLSVLLLEQRTAETFQNKSASQIVEEIAARHQLQADVTPTAAVQFPTPPKPPDPKAVSAAKDAATEAAQAVAGAVVLVAASPTEENKATLARATKRAEDAKAKLDALTAPVGRFYQQDHTLSTLAGHSAATTEWDLLVKIAQEEGYDLYMVGRTLHFHPTTDPASDPYIVRWRPVSATQRFPLAAVRSLNMTRRFVLARPVTVVVQSFHSKQGKAVKASASFGPTSKDTSVAGQHATTKIRPTRYVFNRPNLTQAQADKLAKKLLDEIVKHERTVSWEEPGNTILTPRHMVRLEGTGTGFDQVYYIEHLTRTISFDAGFVLEVHAKNNSPEVANAAAS